MAGVPIPKLHGLIVVGGALDTLSLEHLAPNVTVDGVALAGDYFIRAYTGEATAAGRVGAQLVEELQARIRAAAAANFGSFTLTVSDTGFVTAANPTSFRVRVSGSSEFTVPLGWTSAGTGYGTSHTAPNQHRYGWYPNTGPAEFDGDPDLDGPPHADAVVTRSPSGRVTTTKFFEHVDREFMFDWIEDQYLHPTGSVANRDYQTFWQDVASVGRRWRYYPDRTVQTSPAGGAPWEYVADGATARGGASPDRWKRVNPKWTRLYNGTVGALQYVAT